MAFVNSFLQMLSDGFSGTQYENGFIEFLMKNQSILINFQYIFFLLAYTIRLTKHKNDGVISI